MLKLSEHNFWQNVLKFCNEMDLPIRMIIIYSVKHRHTIRLKFGDITLPTLTKLVLKAKANDQR